MKLSINPNIIGKPAKNAFIDLGHNWINIDVNWKDAFELITQDGYATSAELLNDNRKEANFASRQLLMVDIDSGMTISELLQHDLYNAYGAGFYATPSFTPELHKFRICFILEQAETDASRLRKINRGLLKVFAQADVACKDPTRLFYGSPDCLLCEYTEKMLPTWLSEQLITIVDADDAAIAELMTQHTSEIPQLDDEQRQLVLELLKKTFVGNYPIWRNIGWGLKSGGFELRDFQYVTTGMMNQKTAADAAKVWRFAKAQVGKPVTMGSVIHLLKERHGKDCLREATPVTQFMDTTKRLKQKYNLK